MTRISIRVNNLSTRKIILSNLSVNPDYIDVYSMNIVYGSKLI